MNQMFDGVDFKNKLEDTNLHFFPNQIKSFCFPERNMNFESVKYRAYENDSTISLFGLQLVSGKLSLYRIEKIDEDNEQIFDKNNDHIYIVKNDTSYTELRITESMPVDKYYENKEYIVQLFSLFDNADNLVSEISNTGFNDKDLTKIITIYNSRFSNKVTAVFKNKSKLKIKKGITASFYSLNSTTDADYTPISIGYFWDILDPDHSQHVSWLTGVNYFKPINGINSKDNYISVPLLANVNLSNGTIAPFLNIGFVFYSKLLFQSFSVSTSIGFGTYINDKYLVSIAYEYPSFDHIFTGDYFKYHWLNFKVGVKLY